MKHLGDITKICGFNAPAVNVIIGGSPCQDLSIAGKRAGLEGERSGLFMEQIRIIKEMRAKDEKRGRTVDIRPRYMAWENVPGAFSSHKGKDFQAVLEETVKIIEPKAPPIPMPYKGWPTAGSLVGDRWSIAWRTFDAQYWGTPQRRRRIALIADFGGFTASEILFEREGVSRNNPPGETPWKIFASTIAERFGGTNQERGDGTLYAYDRWQGIAPQSEIAPAITAKYGTGGGNTPLITNQKTFCIQGNAIDRADTAGCNGRGWTEGVSYTLNTVDRPAVYDARGNGNGDTVPTITGDHENRITDYTALCVRERCGCDGGGKGCLVQNEKSGTLRANNDQFVYALERASFNQGINAQYDTKISENGINSTLTAKGPGAVCTSVVRRLTPLECERLNGFPDGWTDIGADYIGTDGKKRKVSDSARYKALGNSIALPSWVWVLERLSYCCGADRTMASLFDGIGGFPLIWETLNGEGACLWASEIEEFPIAVTKHHFK